MRSKLLAVVLPAIFLSLAAAASTDTGLAEIRSLIGEGKTNEALAALDEHLKGSPVDPEGLFLRGLLLAESRQEDRALEIFQETANLRPDRPEPLNNLAVIQAAKGDYEAAVETLKEALRTHPAYRTAYENLTKIYGQLASEAYSRALSIDQARSRSSVELVLLSDMVLGEGGEVRLARGTSIAADPGAAEETAGQPVAIETNLADAAAKAEDKIAQAGDMPASAEQEPPESSEPGASRGQAIEEAIAREPEQTEVEQAEAEPASGFVDPAALANLVEAWALAWSEQQVDEYLSFYGRAFVPAGEIGREDWEEQRRERLSRPEFVRVSVAFLDFEGTGSDRALVRFNQSYESNTFSDVVTKTLQLAREDGEWKIVRETAE